MGLKLITPPAAEPITLAEAKAHLRVVDSDDDAYIAALITAATGNAEAWLGRALVDQTWDYTLDEFPDDDGGIIEIPKPPLISVATVAYSDTSGAETVIAPSDYSVDAITQPGRLKPVADWPDAAGVRVRFRAGYLDTNSPPNAAVPFDIRAGMMFIIANMYEHRENVVVGLVATQLPWGIENLWRPHRVLLGMS